MRALRITGFVVLLATTLGIGIRASYLNLHGRPQLGTSVALGIAVLLLSLVSNRPSLVPPRQPVLTEVNPDAGPEDAYGRDAAGNWYLRDRAGNLYRATGDGLFRIPPAPRPAAWWNWPARIGLLVLWPARAALAGYVSYFVSLELDRGFNLPLLEFAVAGRLLYQLRRVVQHLAGFRLDWSDYRGWKVVRKVANLAVVALLAGYAFVVADLIDGVILGIPRGIYRGLDGLWHLPWFNIPIVVVACLIVFLVLSIAVSWVQGRIARALGPNSELAQKLEDLRLVRWWS